MLSKLLSQPPKKLGVLFRCKQYFNATELNYILASLVPTWNIALVSWVLVLRRDRVVSVYRHDW